MRCARWQTVAKGSSAWGERSTSSRPQSASGRLNPARGAGDIPIASGAAASAAASEGVASERSETRSPEPRVCVIRNQNPGGVAGRRSTNSSRISVFDASNIIHVKAVFLYKQAEFLKSGLIIVMLLLILDILDDNVLVRFTYRKGAIPRLP